MKDSHTHVIILRPRRGTGLDLRFLYLSERHPLERVAYDRLKRRGYDVDKIPANLVEEETP